MRVEQVVARKLGAARRARNARTRHGAPRPRARARSADAPALACPSFPKSKPPFARASRRVVGRAIARVRRLHPRSRVARCPTRTPALSRPTRRRRRAARQAPAPRASTTEATLHAHFRMTGDWHVGRAPTRAAASRPRRARARRRHARRARRPARARDGRALPRRAPARSRRSAPRRPTRRSTARALARARSRARRGPIKPVLLDQRVVAGLGNIYAAEALWRARIDPRRRRNRDRSGARRAPRRRDPRRRSRAAIAQPGRYATRRAGRRAATCTIARAQPCAVRRTRSRRIVAGGPLDLLLSRAVRRACTRASVHRLEQRALDVARLRNREHLRDGRAAARGARAARCDARCPPRPPRASRGRAAS